jgi:hypothetical protein
MLLRYFEKYDLGILRAVAAFLAAALVVVFGLPAYDAFDPDDPVLSGAMIALNVAGDLVIVLYLRLLWRDD